MVKKEEYLNRFEIEGKSYHYYDLAKLEAAGFDIERLPYSIRVLVENLLRKLDGQIVTVEALEAAARWQGTYSDAVEIPYHPARVLMQDFTGVPAVVDLALLRDAVLAAGKDPAAINPRVPVHLVVDHSIQVDYWGSGSALEKNVAKEYERNRERYTVLKWARKNFSNFNVIPPNSGICHQVNLEYLGRVVGVDESEEIALAYPDTLVGTDSHTPMINGIGVLGWGVGGIEAEAVILGEPYYMALPEVVGVRLVGRLREGVTATDLVLTITELLRRQRVVGKFVEYFGPGLKELAIPDRATIANMTPEYGATVGYFPIDETTIDYLRRTNRAHQAQIAEAYAKRAGLFYNDKREPHYSQIIEVDLASAAPSLAGPARPQDRIPLAGMKEASRSLISQKKEVKIDLDGKEAVIADGSVVIAAITSCTNTSNPRVMLGAALLAKKAVEKGLRVPAHVKTSLAPGSKVVVDYLEASALLPYLEALGFYVAAFGCTTCIGNSGPLHPAVERAIGEQRLTAAAVLSGNRNFEARIHSLVRANFLASPMLVVAFALAGRVDIDLICEPLAYDRQGKGVYLRDIWPERSEIEQAMQTAIKEEFYEKQYGVIFAGDANWQELDAPQETAFAWQDDSTYIRTPPFLADSSLPAEAPRDIRHARALLVLGDSITTDHISPAGAIPADYPAGRYLVERGIRPAEFNSYGSRRGSHEVMVRGTFANVRIKNLLVKPKEGGFTLKFPAREEMTVFAAAMKYKAEGTPLIVLAGKEYGTGSSRDWAAKGTMLLGIKAVIAESFERIHRSNLVGMGVLPLVFREGENVHALGLTGSETFFISGIANISPRKNLTVEAKREDGSGVEFEVTARLDTDVEAAYFKAGGILPYVLEKNLS